MKSIEYKGEFSEHFIDGVETPILLPASYHILNAHEDHIIYTNEKGEQIDHYTYLTHDSSRVIVDEFRNQFDHDSIIVMLYNQVGEIFLQVRGANMRWEPNKLDLASIVAQRRAILEKNKYTAVDLNRLAWSKTAEEMCIGTDKIDPKLFTIIGQHYNANTKEYQTIFAYRFDGNSDTLNGLLQKSTDQYKAQGWQQIPYEQLLKEYFSEKVNRFAGGQSLRPINFISNEQIQKTIGDLIMGNSHDINSTQI